MKYILILVEELQPGIPGDEEKYNICVSSDKEKLVEFRNKLSNAIKEFQIEKKNIEKAFILRCQDLNKVHRITSKERIELTSEINKIIETYSNKLDLDFERFRFVEETYFRFRIDKIKELV